MLASGDWGSGGYLAPGPLTVTVLAVIVFGVDHGVELPPQFRLEQEM